MNLELSLRRHDAASYALELRIDQPDSPVAAISHGRLETARLSADQFARLLTEPDQYGQQLGDALWSAETIAAALAEAYAVAQAAGQTIRFQLHIAPDLAELHSLHWETLRHPALGLLSANERILFSRYLPARSYRPVTPRPRSDLRALVFIANPARLNADFGLAPIDVEQELANARHGLADLPLTPLDQPGQGNLGRLLDEMRQGYDIIYIVAHGAFRPDQSGRSQAVLLLEEEAAPNNVAVVYGQELVERIQQLAQPPSLIILASCQSAGSGDQNPAALTALGPALAQAGIPAVIAMQGQVQMDTISKLMPAFFAELDESGEIDRALTIARARIQHEQPDWWMPVLYMTLKNGRLGWYLPGFGGQDERENRVKWRGLQASIRGKKCTPIIGMGPIESWFGSRQAMALAWADKMGFPLAATSRDDLPQVAQFVAISQQSSALPRYDFIDYVYGATWERYGHLLNGAIDKRNQPDPADLNQLMLAVWRQKNETEPTDPYTILASLKQPVYLLADPSDLLLEALKATNATPHPRIAPWNEIVRDLNYEYEDEVGPDWKPSPSEPLVYYLFGRLAEPETLVITEDDYFDYLIQMTRNREEIPDYVIGALSRTALLFLGFRFQDWEFRTFFRILMNQRGKLASKTTHIAAQLEPTEQTILEPRGAKAYLQQYLQQEQIDIFWGRTQDFLKAYQAHTGEQA